MVFDNNAALPNTTLDSVAAPREIAFGPNDACLREDVHRLGMLVGRMLAE